MTAKEDEKAREAIRKLACFRQSFAALAATVGLFGLGTVMAWSFGPEILENVSETELMLLFLTPYIGGALGGPLGGMAIERFGRKRLMMIVSVPTIIGWILVGIGFHFSMTLVGRFLTGLGVGVSFVAAVAYISEVSEDIRRGALLCLVQLMIFSGYLFTDIFRNLVTAKSLAYICGIFPAIHLCLIFYCPESPHFLVGQGRMGDAGQSVTWCRGTHHHHVINEELQSISRSWEVSKRRSSGGCCSRVCIRPVLKPFLICTILMVMVEMSGFSTILHYRESLLSRSGIHLSSNLLLVILGGSLLLFTGLSALLVDRIGRRLLLILSGIITTVTLTTLGTYYFIYHQDLEGGGRGREMQYTWIPGLSFLGYVFGFSLGIGPLPWVLMGEILPPNSKGYYLAPFVSTWFLGMLILKAKWDMVHPFLYVHWKFWIYSIFCFISTVFLLCTVPETKKRSLGKIEQFFASRPKQRWRSSVKHQTVTMSCREISSPEMASLITAKPGSQTPHPNRGRIVSAGIDGNNIGQDV